MEPTDPSTPHLAGGPPTGTPPYVGGFRTFVRRTLFFGTVVVVDACAVLWLADLFYRIGPHRAHIVLLALFALLNGLLVLGSMHAVAGAWEFIKGKWRSEERRVGKECRS